MENDQEIFDKNVKTIATDAAKVEANTVKDEMNTKLDTVEGNFKESNEAIKELANTVNELATAQKNVFSVGKSGPKGSEFSQKISETAAKIKTLKRGETVTMEVTHKDFAASAGAASAPYGDERVVDIKYDPNFQNRLRTMLNGGITSQTGAIRYSEESAETDSAAPKTKGSVGTQSSVTLTDVHQPIQTLFNVLTLPEEWLSDIAMIESYLGSRLMANLLDVEDTQILRGDGTSPNYRGFNTAAVAKDEAAFGTYVGPAFENLFGTNANRFDVLTASMSGLMSNNFMAGLCILHPSDYYAMTLIKSSQNEYVLQQTVAPDGSYKTFWNGVEVMKTPAQAAGTFSVIDKSSVAYWMREGLTFEFNYNDEDFASNAITARAKVRGAVTTYRPNGIVTGTFTNAIAALNL